MLPEDTYYQKTMDDLLQKVNETEAPRPIPTTSNSPYVVAIVVMLALAIIAIVLILSIRPDLDFVIVVSLITGVFSPTTLFLLTFMKANETTNNSREANMQAAATHTLVNNRMKLWVDAARKLAYADGIAEGRRRADERTDELTAKAQIIDVPLKE